MEVIGLDALGVELTRHRIPTPREDYDTSIRAGGELIRVKARVPHLPSHQSGATLLWQNVGRARTTEHA